MKGTRRSLRINHARIGTSTTFLWTLGRLGDAKDKILRRQLESHEGGLYCTAWATAHRQHEVTHPIELHRDFYRVSICT